MDTLDSWWNDEEKTANYESQLKMEDVRPEEDRLHKGMPLPSSDTWTCIT